MKGGYCRHWLELKHSGVLFALGFSLAWDEEGRVTVLRLHTETLYFTKVWLIEIWSRRILKWMQMRPVAIQVG